MQPRATETDQIPIASGDRTAQSVRSEPARDASGTDGLWVSVTVLALGVLSLAALLASGTLRRSPKPTRARSGSPPAHKPGAFARLGRVLRPASAATDGPPLPDRDLSHRPMEVWLTAAVGIFFGAAACALLADFIATRQFPQPILPGSAAVADAQDPHALARTGMRLAITYALSVPLTLLALRLLLDDRSRPDDDLRLSARRVPAALAWSALTLPIVLAVSTLASLALVALEGSPPPAVAHSTLATIVESRAEVWAWVIIAATTLAVPIVEEVLYRGVIQSAILRATGSIWGAVGSTSLLFALVHWPMAPDARSLAIMLPTLAVLSVLMGLAYERTRSLAVPVIMHAAFNGLNVALAVALG